MAERRRFFRIDDEFKVRLVPSNGGPRPPEPVSTEAKELNRALAKLRQRLPEAAEAIEMIARRVAVLEHAGELHDAGAAPAEIVPGSNISGCGLALYSPQPMPRKQMLDLDLYLDSGNVHLRAVGRVVACEPLPDSVGSTRSRGHLVRIDFEQMDSEDEELLVQYVLRRQLRQLREGRLRQDGPPPTAPR